MNIWMVGLITALWIIPLAGGVLYMIDSHSDILRNIPREIRLAGGVLVGFLGFYLTYSILG